MKKKIYAKGRSYYAEGFFKEDNSVILCKGSSICPNSSSSLSEKMKKLRENKEFISSDFEVLKDISFNSASTAATYVTGTMSNGYKVWRYDGTKQLIQKN